MVRKSPLITGSVYHIFNRSIADFIIFNDRRDYQRMLMLFFYFQIENPPSKFSYFIRHKATADLGFFQVFDEIANDQDKNVQIIAYCLMPTHIHMILKQLKDKGISTYLSNISNAYARYFNICHRRKGPLWEGEFKNVLVENNDQLLHLTRYIHLNPVTASLVEKPEDWSYSSYLEYLGRDNIHQFCNYENILEIDPKKYQAFVEDRIDYQKELAKIKKLSIDS